SSLNGTYGSVVINADGSYTYALNNGAANVQALASGQTRSEERRVRKEDSHSGAASATQTDNVLGTNDAPRAGVDDHGVKEDNNTSATGNVLQNVTHGSFADLDEADGVRGGSVTVAEVCGGTI